MHDDASYYMPCLLCSWKCIVNNKLVKSTQLLPADCQQIMSNIETPENYTILMYLGCNIDKLANSLPTSLTPQHKSKPVMASTSLSTHCYTIAAVVQCTMLHFPSTVPLA